MNIFYTILFACFFTLSLKAQKPQVHVLLDQESKTPIAYATIFNLHTHEGTVSNLDGLFNWPSLKSNDTIRITFVGYKPIYFSDRESLPDTIFMQPKAELLNSAYVYGNISFLYDLVSSCKEPKKSQPKTGKTYFSLESTVYDQRIEKLEAYYNGTFDGYNCQNLQLKQGRLAISSFGNRFFLSTETSKAFYLHELFGTNKHFPTSPMGMSKGKLKKMFELTFNRSYTNENNKTIYEIQYKPTSYCEDCFEGTVWIDSLASSVEKITLNTDKTAKHPFIPIGNTDLLLNIALEITKNYTITNKGVSFKSTDFNYRLKYRTTLEDSLFEVKTNAIVYAYDFKNTFQLPQFKYGNIRYQDYILIGSIPYNPFFWNNITEFKVGNQFSDSELLMSNSINKSGVFINQGNGNFRKTFFQNAFSPWSKRRIEFKEVLIDTLANSAMLQAPPSQQYKLVCQIYMDINQLSDSVNVVTKSFFDPYYSYYYLPRSQVGNAFINMYFDLVEIKRLELEQRISGMDNIQQIKKEHLITITELENIQKTFLKDVQRGSDPEGMMKWNTYIYEHLKVDNIGLFQLYPEE